MNEDERIMNMDYASLYPTEMARLWDSVRPRLDSFSVKRLIIKSPEELIENWENEIENDLRMQEFRFFPFFPEMQMVSARTVGLDLVAVQPMAAPQGILHYLDYVYEPNEEE